jgi:hypothetical protein
MALLSKRERRYEEAMRHLEKAIMLNPPDLVLTTLLIERTKE